MEVVFCNSNMISPRKLTETFPRKDSRNECRCHLNSQWNRVPRIVFRWIDVIDRQEAGSDEEHCAVGKPSPRADPTTIDQTRKERKYRTT
jgi:hypothetical protein